MGRSPRRATGGPPPARRTWLRKASKETNGRRDGGERKIPVSSTLEDPGERDRLTMTENVSLMGSERRAWPQSPGEERKLVDRMRAGEESAFEMFAECYIPALYRFAGRRLDNDRELSQEIVQSTVCKVIEKLGSYRAEAALFTWLCACCKNEIAAHYRRLARRPREVELDEGMAETTPTGGFPLASPVGLEERLSRAERAELVHVALDRLPESYARAMEWRYLEGLEVTEIAHRLESSYKAAESLLSRARKAFREAYEKLAENQGAEEAAGTSPKEGLAP